MLESRPEDNSDIPVLQPPAGGFKSRIPASLLEDKSPEERDLYNDISKISAWVDWAAPIMIDSNLQQRRTNGRLLKVEANIGDVQIKELKRFKDMILSWWGLILGAITLIGGITGIIAIIEFITSFLSAR